MIHKNRCNWASSNEFFFDYHDNEWCVENHNDSYLFELLNLEGAQAGLSWLTILKKRQNYLEAFDNFEPNKIIKYDENKINQLMNNSGIVRNKLKINAVIKNSNAFLEINKEFGTFDKYIWSFSENKIIKFHEKEKGIEISKKLSKDLLKHGFKFVGPTICYAYMESIGMINNHDENCYKHIK